MVRKINKRIRRSNTFGMFHDTRADIRTLTTFLNEISDKIDEVIDVVNTDKK